MSNLITSATPSALHQPASVERSTASSHKSTKSNLKPTVPSTDTVHISSTAQAALAALKEAAETPDQTAQEAGGGDPLAQKLLAKEAATRAAQK